MIALPRRAASEAVGTFALTFAGCGAVVADQQLGGAVTHVGIALTFGLVVMAMIYSIGEVSGAHINPAVSIAFAVAGRLSLRDASTYCVAQCSGAFVAGVALLLIFPDAESFGKTEPSGAALQSLGMEVLLTFLLMFVILCVATGSKEQGLMAGIAIGGTVALNALFGGPVSGASMNPARSLGPALVAMDFAALWIYIVAPIGGAALAVPVWMYTVKAARPPTTGAA